MGVDGCRHIVDAIDAALRERVPVIGIWHSGGARLAEGVEALDGVGEVFAAMVRASGRVPQISVVLGAAAGGAAYGPALTDLVIMGPDGRVFVTGPDVVRSVTGEDVDQEQLGGPDTHGRRSPASCTWSPTPRPTRWRRPARRSTCSPPGHLRPGRGRARRRPGGAAARAAQPRLRRASRWSTALLDGPGLELHPRWAPNIVIDAGPARPAGRSG